MFALSWAMPRNNESITMEGLKQSISGKQVQSIVIRQNAEVPTGVADVSMTDGKVYTLTTDNVTTLQEELKQVGYNNYTLRDVPHNQVLMAVIPSVVIGLVMVIFFMLIMGMQ